MNNTTKDYIERLTKENNIEYKETGLDIFAKKITELSGDEITTDHINDLLIELKRSKIITSRELVSLASNYLKEKKGS